MTELIIPQLAKFLISVAVISICIRLVFYANRKINSREEEKMTDNHFIVMHSKIIAIIGIIADVLFAIIIVGVTFSQQMSDIVTSLIFYSVLGLCFAGGLYLVLKSVKCKIIINGIMPFDHITITPRI